MEEGFAATAGRHFIRGLTGVKRQPRAHVSLVIETSGPGSRTLAFTTQVRLHRTRPSICIEVRSINPRFSPGGKFAYSGLSTNCVESFTTF